MWGHILICLLSLMTCPDVRLAIKYFYFTSSSLIINLDSWKQIVRVIINMIIVIGGCTCKQSINYLCVFDPKL